MESGRRGKPYCHVGRGLETERGNAVINCLGRTSVRATTVRPQKERREAICTDGGRRVRREVHRR